MFWLFWDNFAIMADNVFHLPGLKNGIIAPMVISMLNIFIFQITFWASMALIPLIHRKITKPIESIPAEVTLIK